MLSITIQLLRSVVKIPLITSTVRFSIHDHSRLKCVCVMSLNFNIMYTEASMTPNCDIRAASDSGIIELHSFNLNVLFYSQRI